MSRLTREMWLLAAKRGDTNDSFADWQEKMSEGHDTRNIRFKCSRRELAAILTGLNFVHARLQCDPEFAATTEELRDIMTDGGTISLITAEQVNQLADDLNSGAVDPVLAYLFTEANGKVVTVGTKPPTARCRLKVVNLVAQ